MTERSLDNTKSRIEESIRQIRAALPEGVTLMAATKTVNVELINHAILAGGLTDIGENRVQELLEKYEALAPVRLHFIGSLQVNKVKYLIGKVCLIHSLDSEKLAAEISKRSLAQDLVTECLCEVNIGNEEAKGGIPEEEVEAFLQKIAHLSGLRVRGLMVIGPHCEDVNDYRPYFARTKALFDRLRAAGYFGDDPILSMGMSDNYALAASYGATLVRPGSAVFGARSYPTKA